MPEIKTARFSPNRLDEIVIQEAKDQHREGWSEAFATPPVYRAASNFEKAVANGLSIWLQKTPAPDGATAANLMQEEGSYLVYQALVGEVSPMRKHWGHAIPNIAKAVIFLQYASSKEFKAFSKAVQLAAEDTTYLSSKVAQWTPGSLRDDNERDTPIPSNTSPNSGIGSGIPSGEEGHSGQPQESLPHSASVESLWGRLAQSLQKR